MTITVIENLAPLAANYDALLCDAWGVIHNGAALNAGVEKAMISFRRERGPLIILTNAPRPSSIIPAQLDRLGLSREAYDGVVTSGDATRAAIASRLPAPAFRLGPDKDDALYEDLHIEFAPLEEASFIVCTGLFNDQVEDPEDYRDLLMRAAARTLPMICANPDIMVNWGGRLVYCAGALAQLYEALGGKVIYGGKPHRPIYELAFQSIDAAAARAIDKSRVLAVGDGLATDIKGANIHGVDVLLVTGANGLVNADDDPGAALCKAGLDAVAAMETLQW